MASKDRYLKQESNNVTRRLVNISMGYPPNAWEGCHDKSVNFLDEMDEAIRNLAQKYKISEDNVKLVLSQFVTNR